MINARAHAALVAALACCVAGVCLDAGPAEARDRPHRRAGSWRAPRKITVYAFRQTEDPAAKNAFLYANTGHVGFSLDGGKTILGFNPQLKNTDRSQWPRIIERLAKGAVMQGVLSDDTATFARARSFQIPVLERTIELSVCEYSKVRAAVLVDRLLGRRTWKRYSFPAPFGRSGVDRGTYNCAYYLKSIGLGDKTPFPNGRLQADMGGPDRPLSVPAAGQDEGYVHR